MKILNYYNPHNWTPKVHDVKMQGIGAVVQEVAEEVIMRLRMAVDLNEMEKRNQDNS